MPHIPDSYEFMQTAAHPRVGRHLTNALRSYDETPRSSGSGFAPTTFTPNSLICAEISVRLPLKQELL